MDRILGIVLLVLLSGSALIALLASVALLFPSPVEQAREIIASVFGRSFLLGLVNFLFFGVIAALLGRFAQGAGRVLSAVLLLLALLILLALTIFSILGLSALTKLAGERISEGTSPLRKQLRGGLLLVLAGLTPYIGWFVFTPLLMLTGLGAALQATFRKKEKVE